MKYTFRLAAMAALLAGLSLPTVAFAEPTTPSSNLTPIEALQISYQNKVTGIVPSRPTNDPSVVSALPIETAANLHDLNFGMPDFGFANDTSAQSESAVRATWEAGP